MKNRIVCFMVDGLMQFIEISVNTGGLEMSYKVESGTFVPLPISPESPIQVAPPNHAENDSIGLPQHQLIKSNYLPMHSSREHRTRIEFRPGHYNYWPKDRWRHNDACSTITRINAGPCDKSRRHNEWTHYNALSLGCLQRNHHQ